MDTMTLIARLTLNKDDYDKGLNDASKEANSAGGKIGSLVGSIGSGVGKALKIAAGAATAAVGAATTGAAMMAKAAVSSYAEYEQLVGGVQKLYGNMGQSLEEYAKSQGKTTAEVKDQWMQLEKAQTEVLKNADNAYKTAGMSANQYMEIATSFSASLINSLGGDTVAAAAATDKAMSAISDNVNTFGSDMESVTNAFQGFAKQNYTMLDNLKLGYGGTKEGMQQLIDDANAYAKANGQAADLSIDSFADIVEAIDLVQQKQNIAGTTAREAMTTIQGAASATKAAWGNVMTAIAGGGDLTAAMDGLINSIFGEKEGEGLLNQIVPRVKTAMEGIGNFVSKAAPYITEKIPELISAILPSLTEGGVQLLGAVGEGLQSTLPTLLHIAGDLLDDLYTALLSFDWSEAANSMTEKISSLFDVGGDTGGIISKAENIVLEFANGIGQAAPSILPAIANLLSSIGQALVGNSESIVGAATSLIQGLASGLSSAVPILMPAIINIATSILQMLIDTAPTLLSAGVELINGLVQGLTEALPVLIDALPGLVQSTIDALIEMIPVLIDGAMQLITGVTQALPEIIQSLVDALPQIIDSIVSGLLTALPQLIEGLVQLNLALVQAMPEIIAALIEAIPQIITSLIQVIIENGPMFLEAMGSIVTSLVEYLAGCVGTFGETVGTIGSTILSTLGSWLSQMPAKLAYWAGYAIGSFYVAFKNLPEKIKTTVSEGLTKIKEWGIKLKEEAPKIAKKFVDDLHTKMKELPAKMKQIGIEVVTSIWNGLKEKWEWLKSQVANLASSLAKGAKDALNKGKGAGGEEGGEGGEGAGSTQSIRGYAYDSVVGYNSGAALAFAGGGMMEYVVPNVNVYLQGDTAKLFKVIRQENGKLVKRTGSGM